MKILAILMIFILLFTSIVIADEFNDCPGPQRTIRGTVWLTEGETWSQLRPMSGVRLTVESKCGFSYEDIVSDQNGEFSIRVQGPVTVDVKKGQQYFGYGSYLHNKNNDVDIRVQEGREIFINVLNPRYRTYPKSKNILECEDGKVHHFWHPQIYLTRDMGECVLTAHDGVRAYQGDISLDTVGVNVDVELDKKVSEIRMPKLKAKPSETVFKISKGWNLIPFGMIGNGRTTCFYNDEKPFSFFYEPLTKKFLSGRAESYYEALYQKDPKLLEDNNDLLIMNLGLGVMWFASPVDCEILFEMQSVPSEIEQKLFAGWNLRYVNEHLQDATLNKIRGDCSIEKAYYFDGKSQEWETITAGEELEYGKGFIIKVTEDCTLNTVAQGMRPPSMPN
ncbi:hypothetical protein KY325_03765 [Candidatus Woesearchaeota archaeon]|nr:hypothetical protein [Candidatus Woesearchaeota archaeon]MBW3018250.1 hypothetical protein [Candidatus Woesearchaeota archaeon]